MITELIPFEDLVKNRYFNVPDYQRGYSWEEDQVNDLTKDIEHIAEKDHKHYTGTLVISRKEDEKRYDIVDGQQRITTLIILLKCLSEKLPSEREHIYENYIFRGDEYVLQTNKETREYFRENILKDSSDGEEDLKSLRNLRDAKQFLTKWLNENQHRLELIYQVVTQKLGFLCFAPSKTAEIGIMFEVINNRGKDLSELEKIKNYFIYYATIKNDTQLRIKIDDVWEKLLKRLNMADVVSNDEENRFLRNCYLVFYDPNKSKSWYVYDRLRERYSVYAEGEELERHLEEIDRFIDFIVLSARAYAWFFNLDCNPRPPESLRQVLTRLHCHQLEASILPLYLAIVHEVDTQETEVAKLLRTLEILNFRTYVLPNAQVVRADSKQGDLFYYANQFFRYNQEGGATTENFDWLEQLLVDFTREVCPQKVFVQSLTIDTDESIDYHHWHGLKFFLASYEEALNLDEKASYPIEKILYKQNEENKDRTNDKLTAEHIWARKNKAWVYPEDHLQKRRLGNFCLMGLRKNIQLANDDIPVKVDRIQNEGTIRLIQVSELSQYLRQATQLVEKKRKNKVNAYYLELSTWLNDLRETKLIAFALDRWPLPEEVRHFEEVNSDRALKEKKNHSYFLKDEGH